MWKWKSVWHYRTLFFEPEESKNRIFAVAAAQGKRDNLTWATLRGGRRTKGDIQDQGETLGAFGLLLFLLMFIVHVKLVLLAVLVLILPVVVCFLAIAAVSNANNGVINVICCCRWLPNCHYKCHYRSAVTHSAFSNRERKMLYVVQVSICSHSDCYVDYSTLLIVY